MSMITFTSPRWLNTLTLPPVPRRRIAELAMTSPGSALLAEVKGCGEPVGHTVTKLLSVASSSIVMLAATEVASAGMPFTPATWTSMV